MRHFILAFLMAIAVPVTALADGVFWQGGVLSGGVGGGVVDPTTDLELNVGVKLVFDADATANDYLSATSDGNLAVVVQGTTVSNISSSGMRFQDNIQTRWGSSNDYRLQYNSSGQLELLDIGSAVIFKVDDGTDDVDFSGSLNLNIGETLALDADGNANATYITATADDVMRFYVSAAQVFFSTPTQLTVLDSKNLNLGTDGDYTLVYDSGNTQFELNSANCGGATPCTLLSVDDGDGIFDLRNGEFFHNDSDGKITLGGGGGTNNEDIVLDFETSANRIEVSSNTDMNLFDFNNIGVLTSTIYVNTQASSSGASVAGITYSLTNAQTIFSNSAAYGNHWVFGAGASVTKDFDHVPQTNPTLYVHSDSDPDLGNTEWLSLHHNVTEGRIETGTGKIGLGGIGLTNNEDLVFDFETTPNYVTLTSNTGATILSATSFSSLFNTVRVNQGGFFYWSGRTELLSAADGQMQIEQSDNLSGVTLDANDAADTLTIKDQAGTGNGNLKVTGTLSGLNDEFIKNDSDGKWTLGGAGGTNNEAITLDFETSANQVNVESTTGITTYYFGSSIRSAANMTVGAANGFYALGRARLASPADGQWVGSNNAASSGAVLDFDDVADTLTIKDQAGTAAGHLALLEAGKLTFDADEDGDTYLSNTLGSNDFIYVYNNGSPSVAFTTAGPLLYDSKALRFGNAGDQTITYTNDVATVWNDGTNDVITIPDDTGIVETNVGRNIATRIIDVDDSPYTVLATDEVIVVDTDSGTGAPAAVTVNLPAAACGITIGGTEKDSCRIIRIKNIGGTSNVTVDANGAEEIDNATTATLTPGQSITLIDTNQTDYHWIIE